MISDELVIVTDMNLNDDEKESCYQEEYLGENTNKLNEICQQQLGKDCYRETTDIIYYYMTKIRWIRKKAENCRCTRFLKKTKWQKFVELSVNNGTK